MAHPSRRPLDDDEPMSDKDADWWTAVAVACSCIVWFAGGALIGYYASDMLKVWLST